MLSRRALPTLNSVLRHVKRYASTSPTKPADAAKSLAQKETVQAPAATLQQSPNHPSTWSTSQRPRPGPGAGIRFEQTIMELQPSPLSAMELIAEEPIRLVHGRKAVCDGGGGPLGHPKIYINLDQPGSRACGYCGIRFEQDPHHHH